MSQRSSSEDRDGRFSVRPSDAHVAPDIAGADEDEQSSTSIASRPELSEAQTLSVLHDVAGNELLGAALSGEQMDGFGTAIATQMTGALGGLQGGGPLSSNTAMTRLMRYAEALELDVASDAIAASSGRHLEAAQRERLETAFDHDFGHVQIHADGAAERAAEALNAHAFALGAEVFFGRGGYRPGTAFTDRLLAHELTHVVQHDEGRLPSAGSDMEVSSPSDAHEREAYANETRILRRLVQVDQDLSAEAEQPAPQVDVEPETAVEAEPETAVETETAESEPEPEPVETEAAAEAAAETAAQPETAAPALGDDGDPSGDPAPDAPSDGAPAMLKRNAGGGRLRAERAPEERTEQSAGRPLPDAVAQRMSAALGHRFEGVRIHTDAAAGEAARDLGARAFALGADVFFAPGEYRPGTEAGEQTLAHELAHVKQHDEGQLDGLFGPEMYISKPTDAAEQDADAQAEEAMATLGAVDEATAALGGTPDAAAVISGLQEPTASGPVTDADADRRDATASLLRDLTRRLGLSLADIHVRVDEVARERTRAVGALGLMEQGEILLDPSSYDPSAREGRALLAHEVVHVAQQDVAFREGASGALAEAEADALGDALVGGGPAAAAGEPTVALPAGHTARQSGGGAATAAIQARLQAFDATTAPEVEAMQTNADSNQDQPNSPGAPPDENREEKVERYEDGVDGIADQIKDLSAFDDLYDAYDDYEGAERQRRADHAMARIRGTKEFERLAEQWKGAIMDDEDGAQMMAAFNEEFDGRGFWHATEMAFDHIEREAKAKGRQLAAEEAAKKRKAGEARQEQDGQANGDQGNGGQGDAGAGAGGAGQGGPGSGGSAPGEGSVADRASSDAPPLPQFQQADVAMQPGGVMEQIESEVGHYGEFQDTMTEAAGSTGTRFNIISSELARSFSTGFMNGFIDGARDSLILNTLGSVGDMALNSVSKGLLGDEVPVIGPAIQLIQSGVFTSDFYTVDKNPWIQGGEKAWEGAEKAGQNFMAAFGEGLSFTDRVGLLCAAAADFIGALADLLDTIAQVLGVLSALCYILGAIFIIVGICLSWLGLGFLVPAGYWLVEAGSILADIVTVLGPIVIALKAYGLIFRVAAAFMVPAGQFGEQVHGVDEDAEGLGDKVGVVQGDALGEHVREHVSHAPENRHAEVEEGTPSSASDHQSGASDASSETSAAQGHQDNATHGNEQLQGRVEDLQQRHDDAQGQVEAAGPSAQAPNEEHASPRGEEESSTPPPEHETQGHQPEEGGQGHHDEEEGGTGHGHGEERPGLVRLAAQHVLDRLRSINNFEPLKDGVSHLREAVGELDRLRPSRFREVTGEHLQRVHGRMQDLESSVRNKQHQIEELRANAIDMEPHQAGVAEAHIRRLEREVRSAQRQHQAAERLLRIAEGQSRSPEEHAPHGEEGGGTPHGEHEEGAGGHHEEGEEKSSHEIAEEERAARTSAHDAQEELPRQHREHERLDHEIKEQEHAIDEARHLKAEHERALPEAERQAQHFHDQAEQQARLVERLQQESQVQQQQESVQQLERYVDDIQRAREELSSGNTDDQVQIMAHEDAEGLSVQLASERAKLDQMESTLADHRERYGQLVEPDAQPSLERAQAQHEATQQLAAEHDDVVQQHRDAIAEQEETIRSGNDALDEKRPQLEQLGEQIDHNQEKVDHLRERRDDQARESRDEHMGQSEGDSPLRAFFARASSGNAMGGKGSSYEAFLEYLGEWLEERGQKQAEAEVEHEEERKAAGLGEEEGSEEQGGGQPHPAPAGQGAAPTDGGGDEHEGSGGGEGGGPRARNAQEAFLLQQEWPEEEKSMAVEGLAMWNEFGKNSAEFVSSGLMNESIGPMLVEPPKEVPEMEEKYHHAQEEAHLYLTYWAAAHDADGGAQLVQHQVDQHRALDEEDAATVEQNVCSMEQPIAQGQADEAQRQSQLAGGDPQTQQSDSRQGGMMSRLMGYMSGDGADYADGGPSGSDAGGAGNDASGGQDAVNQGAQDTQSTTNDASSGQHDNLVAISSAREQVATSVADSRTQIQAKVTDEQGQQTQVESMREDYLAEAYQHKDAAEQDAQSFNADVAAMTSWAFNYRKARGENEHPHLGW